MNAMAVPPPTWVPIGAREIQSLARRFLRHGLILSGVCHFAILVALLYVASRNRDASPEWSYARVSILDPAPRTLILPPRPAPPSAPTHHPSDGPVEPVDLPLELGPVDAPGPVSAPTAAPGEKTAAGPMGATTVEATPTGLPGEGEFRPYDEAPTALERRVPQYPPWALEAGISGTVLLHVIVGPDGRVKRVTVIRDVKGLTGAAQDAISKWVFRPAMANGHPVEVWVEIPVVFRL